MKKWVKIGFPIACVLIVGGTLISVSNLKKQAENLPSNNLNVNNSLLSDNTSFESKNKTPIISVNDINTNVNTKNNTNTNTSTNTNTKIGNTNVNKVANNSSKNTIKNTVNTAKNNTSINNSSEETDKDLEKKDDKEKAIALASEEWGEDSEVYYTNEGMSSGYYIVAVRDKSNTSVKMFYKVDINNNTVEIDW